MSYSKVLVTLQFLFLALLALPFGASFIPYAYVIIPILLLVSLNLALWTFRHNTLGNFNIVPDIKEHCTLITTGPYRYIRHPMYLSVTLLAMAMLCHFAWWKVAVFAGLIVVLYYKASYEERLWCVRDVRYEAYRRHSKMFVPFIL